MNTYNAADLQALKIADITDLYNQFATITGDKQIKKFSDKTTAVKRTLAIQEVAAPYMNVEPEAEVEPVTLTDKEHVALMAIAQNGLDGMGGEEPADLHSDNFSWFDNSEITTITGMSKHQCSGLMASLEEKGLIVNSEEGVNGEGPDQWYLSDTGIDLAQSLKDQPLPEVTKPAKKAKKTEDKPVEDNVVTLGKNTPKAETSHGILIAIVQNNGGEMLTSELAEQFAEEYGLVYKGAKKVDISFAKGYIKGAIRKVFLK